MDEFQQARDLGFDTDELRYDIEFCRIQIPTERTAGIVGLQQLIRKEGVSKDVLASAVFALIKTALARPGDVDLPPQSTCELLQRIGPCGPLFAKAGCALLGLAQIHQDAGAERAAAESVDAARACCQLALQYGVPAVEIDRIRDRYPLIHNDARFRNLKPDGTPIRSEPEPLAVLDPAASVPHSVGH
jgi:hypothetical protein